MDVLNCIGRNLFDGRRSSVWIGRQRLMTRLLAIPTMRLPRVGTDSAFGVLVLSSAVSPAEEWRLASAHQKITIDVPEAALRVEPHAGKRRFRPGRTRDVSGDLHARRDSHARRRKRVHQVGATRREQTRREQRARVERKQIGRFFGTAPMRFSIRSTVTDGLSVIPFRSLKLQKERGSSLGW